MKLIRKMGTVEMGTAYFVVRARPNLQLKQAKKCSYCFHNSRAVISIRNH